MNTSKKIDLSDKKNIIFDMDGTLIDSSRLIANTINFVRKEHNLQPIEIKTLLEAVNNPEINSPQFFYEVQNYTQKHVKLFESYYSENLHKEIIIYPEVEIFLETLKNKNYSLFVATNASTKFAVEMLKHLNILHYFKEVVGVSEKLKPKPAPDMLLYILEKYKLANSDTSMIGDSKKDIFSAQKCDIFPILVKWGFSDHSNEKSQNFNIITSFEELSI